MFNADAGHCVKYTCSPATIGHPFIPILIHGEPSYSRMNSFIKRINILDSNGWTSGICTPLSFLKTCRVMYIAYTMVLIRMLCATRTINGSNRTIYPPLDSGHFQCKLWDDVYEYHNVEKRLWLSLPRCRECPEWPGWWQLLLEAGQSLKKIR